VSEQEYLARAVAARVAKGHKARHGVADEFESDDEDEVKVVTTSGGAGAAADADGGADEDDEGDEDDMADADPLMEQQRRRKERAKAKAGEGQADRDDDSSAGEEEDEAEGAAGGADGAAAFDSADDDSHAEDKAPTRRVAKVRGEAEAASEGGERLEAFNLDEERRHGYFEENFNYVRTGGDDDEKEDDAWLESVRTGRLRAADAAAPVPAARAPAEARGMGVREAAVAVAELAGSGESVQRALARLGRAAGSGRRAGRRAPAASSSSSSAAEAAAAKAAIGRLSDAASALLAAGDADAYDRTPEDVGAVAEALWRAGEGRDEAAREAAAAQAAFAASARTAALGDDDAILWVYRVSGAGEEHGPFSSTQMLQWSQGGFFDGEAAQCRRVRKASGAAQLEADLDMLDGGDGADAAQVAVEPASGWQAASEVSFRAFAAKE